MEKRDFLKTSALAAAGMAVPGGVKELVAQEKSAEVPRTNWSGTLHYHTDHVVQPASTEEVQAAVRAIGHGRALGTRHAFNGIADSTDTQISTLKMKTVELDAARKMVQVGAGVRYGDLALEIDRQGFALHNLASLPHISVGGAVATATHGSGVHNGNLATPVREVEFVSADGQVRRLSAEKDGDKFNGAVVALGALGVATHLTLAVQPKFEVTQTLYENLPFAALEKHLREVMSAGYSVSLFTNWMGGEAQEVWIKRRVDQGGSKAMPATFFGATMAKEKLHPIRGLPTEAVTDQMNTPGPWYERLPHFRMAFTPSAGNEIQTEYFVPFEHGYEAIRAVETLRDRVSPHLLVTEVRAIAADDLWMSMAYKRESLALHFTWKPEAEAVNAVLPALEAKLAPFDARPHWAKVFAMDARRIDGLYPRMRDFKALMAEYDPVGKFRNAFVQNVLG